LTRGGALGIVALAVSLVLLNRPMVESQWWERVPESAGHAPRRTSGDRLRDVISSYAAIERAAWQRRHLARLEKAEAVARAQGISREGIQRAFGRLDAPELPADRDAVDLMDVPLRSGETDVGKIRRTLAPYVVKEPEPKAPNLP
jgi:hypothetical protein